MKKFILLIFFTAATFLPVDAQTSIDHSNSDHGYKKGAVYLETGGPTLLYSLGGEASFYHNRRFSVITGMGACYVPTPGGVVGIYLQPGILFHFGKSAIESGAGPMLMLEGSEYGSDVSYFIALSSRLGYRYTFGKNRFFLRSGITPLFDIGDESGSSDNNEGFIFWLNPITFGFRF